MDIPSWNQQEVVKTTDDVGGFFTSDGTCFLNMSYTPDTYVVAAQSFVEALKTSQPSLTYTYDLSDTVVSVTYEIPNVVYYGGMIKILSCPQYTYIVDYRCPKDALIPRKKTIDSVFSSMQC